MSPRTLRAFIFVLIMIGLLTAGFFGIRAIFALREFQKYGPPHRPPFAEASERQPAETDIDLIRDWMTVPYIAKTYQVSPRILFEALGISPRGNEGKSLAQLNEEYLPGSPGLVIEVVKGVIRANQPEVTDIIPDSSVTPTAP